jgi:hypothetical protein
LNKVILIYIYIKKKKQDGPIIKILSEIDGVLCFDDLLKEYDNQSSQF